MAQSWTFAHQQFVQQLQVVSSSALKLNNDITNLGNFFDSAGIQGGAMTDAEIQAFGPLFQALTAAQVTAGMTDLRALQTAMPAAMQQRFSNLLCGVPK